MPHQNLTLVAPPERIQTIDIIRGFALFGVTIIGFTVDNGSNAPWQGWSGFGDQLIYWTFRFFIDDKFINIYCFLFGLGFAIQMQKAENTNSPFTFIFLRRLIALYFIGVVCAILIRYFSIVFILYAIAGFLLLIFRRVPLKLVLIFGVCFYMAPWAKEIITSQKIHSALNQPAISSDSAVLKKFQGVYGTEPGWRTIITAGQTELKYENRQGKEILIHLSDNKFFSKKDKTFFTFTSNSSDSITGLKLSSAYVFENKNKKIDMLVETAREELQDQKSVVPKNENYWQMIINNIIDYRNSFRNWSWKNFFWLHFSGTVPLLFLIGMYAGRKKIFYNIADNNQLLRNSRLWGLLLGAIFITIHLGRIALKYIAGSNWKPVSDFADFLIRFCWPLGCVLMAIGIIAALTLALEKENWKKKLAFLIPVGRMGFTNYILGLSFGFLIFAKWGLNMRGKVGGLYGFLIVIPVCITIYFLSRWWLNHFKYGPFEWLWRSLTYLKFQPMRLKLSDRQADRSM